MSLIHTIKVPETHISRKAVMEIAVKLWRIAKPFHFWLCWSLVLLAVTQILNLIPTYLLGIAFDTIPSRNSRLISFLVGGAFVTALFTHLIQSLRDRIEISKLDEPLLHYLDVFNLKRYFQLSPGQILTQNTHYIQSVMNSGQSALSSAIFQVLYNGLPVLFSLVFSTLAVIWLTPMLGLICLAGIAAHFSLTIYHIIKINPRVRRIAKVDNLLSQGRGDLVDNATTVMLSGQTDRHQQHYIRESGLVRLFSVETWIPWYNSRNIGQTYLDVAWYTGLCLGLYQLFHGEITIGYLVTYNIWGKQALRSIEPMGSIIRELLKCFVRLRKYFQLLEVESDVKSPEHPVVPETDDGSIQFEDVHYKYAINPYLQDPEDSKEDEKPSMAVLNGLSLEIQAGLTYAFVGPSGAGKSTLIHLMCRNADPASGSVRLNGVDLRSLDLSYIRQRVGLVEQNVRLLDDTLRTNLTISLSADSEISDEELTRICGLAGVSEFWHKLPDGFDTKIGQNGVKLSGGQRQRVAIARALVKDSKILIFDEATSALDAANEALIQESIKQVSVDRTVIIIAHRLSTVMHADVIFVMKDGQVLAQGRHHELLRTCELYRDLVRTQMQSPVLEENDKDVDNNKGLMAVALSA